MTSTKRGKRVNKSTGPIAVTVTSFADLVRDNTPIGIPIAEFKKDPGLAQIAQLFGLGPAELDALEQRAKEEAAELAAWGKR